MKRGRLISLLVVAAATSACRASTEIELDVRTNIACSLARGTTVFSGGLGSTERAAAPTLASTACAFGGEIGTLYTGPNGDKSSLVEFKVIVGVDAPAERCTAANRYQGCIVQRRGLRYLAHSTLHLPVDLALVCKDVPCDENTTCSRLGTCVDKNIDPDSCADDVCELPADRAAGAGGGPGSALDGGPRGDGGDTTDGGPVSLAPPSTLALGNEFSCALTSGGGAACWGSNSSGQGGRGDDGPYVSHAVTVLGVGGTEPLVGAQSIVASNGAHICAIVDAEGHVACWGNNGSGQLSGSMGASYYPAPVAGVTAIALAANETATFAVTPSHRLVLWGRSPADTMTYRTPIDMPGLSDVQEVAVGTSHACARLGNGTVQCWGDDTEGQLGDASQGSGAQPRPVVGLTDAVQLAAGGRHTCAVRSGGGVVCWGPQDFGEIGNGTFESREDVPVALGITDAVQLALGNQHTCVRRALGLLSCWGYNASGQLGLTSFGNMSQPTPLMGFSGVLDLAAGTDHTCARFPTGIRCWGHNHLGELGDMSIQDRNSPTPVTGL